MTERPSHLYCANPTCCTTGIKDYNATRALLSNTLLPGACFRTEKKSYQHYCKGCRSTPAVIPVRVCSAANCIHVGAPQLASNFGPAGNGISHSCNSCKQDPTTAIEKYKQELRDAGITGPLNLGVPQTAEERAAQVPGVSRYCTNAGCPQRARWPLLYSEFNAGNPGCAIALDARCNRCKHFDYVFAAIAALEKPSISTTQDCSVCLQAKPMKEFLTVHHQAKTICKDCDNKNRRATADTNRKQVLVTAICAHPGGCSNPWRNMNFEPNHHGKRLSELVTHNKYLENLNDYGHFLCDYHHEVKRGTNMCDPNTRLQLCNDEKIHRGECVDCHRKVNGDEYSPPCMFDFDHRPEAIKIMEISSLVYSPLTTDLHSEMSKCDLRCKRCHITITKDRCRKNKIPPSCGKRPMEEMEIPVPPPPAKKSKGPRSRTTTGLGKGKRAIGSITKERRLPAGSYICLKCRTTNTTSERTTTGTYCPRCVDMSANQARVYAMATTSHTLYCANALCSRAKVVLVASTSFRTKPTKNGCTIMACCSNCTKPYVAQCPNQRVCVLPTCKFAGNLQDNTAFVAQHSLKSGVNGTPKLQRVCNTCVEEHLVYCAA